MGIYLVLANNGIANNCIVAESLEDAEAATGSTCIDITNESEPKPAIGWRWSNGEWTDIQNTATE